MNTISLLKDRIKRITSALVYQFILRLLKLQKGHGYFYKRRDKYQSSVFKVNMGVKGVHVCDRMGIKVLFDMDKVGKILPSKESQ